MRVKMQKLLKNFMLALDTQPHASIVHSLAASPALGDFLDDLDPNLSLDWSAESFQGLPSLREKVLARMGYAPACHADDVLITAGAAEANFLSIMRLLNPGDELIVDWPTWPQPIALGQALHATIKKLPRREENDWNFDIDECADLITGKTKLIFICNPNNPTGHLLDQNDLNKIANLAERVGAYVLTDEVYRGLEWNGSSTPCLANLYHRGISTGSVSKALGLQGLRVGWLVCRNADFIKDAMVLRENSSEIMNILGETIAEIALGESRYQQMIQRAQQQGRQNLEILEQFITDTPQLSWRRPLAGLIGLCRLDLPFDGDELFARLINFPYHTFIMPGSAYGFPQHVRLGVGGGPEAKLQQGLQQLKKLLDTI